MILATFFLILFLLLAFAATTSFLRRRLAAAPPPFDIDRARAESHRAGFAFPEADGTLSQPHQDPIERDRAIETHRKMHARRLAAEPDGLHGDENFAIWRTGGPVGGGESRAELVESTQIFVHQGPTSYCARHPLTSWCDGERKDCQIVHLK